MKTLAALFLLTLPCWSMASGLSVTLTLQELVIPLDGDTFVHLRFGDERKIFAIDEHGRSCTLHDGQLQRFERDGEFFWRLEQSSSESPPLCLNGMIFKIDPQSGRFIRHDHGFEEIFKYYARRACWVGPRALSEDESQKLAACFLKPKKWAAFKAALNWYLGRKPTGSPKDQACTRELLRHEDLEVICSDHFKKLANASAFNDVIVIKEGSHRIRGGGSLASNYIVHPDFKGDIDLRGHSLVFHLPHHQCRAEDVFRGCIVVGGAKAILPLQ